jgi:hypothetical protein
LQITLPSKNFALFSGGIEKGQIKNITPKYCPVIHVRFVDATGDEAVK